MARTKMVYLSVDAHRLLKILAARKDCTMGKLIETLVAREAEEQGEPWLSPPGLAMQESVVGEAWSDPELDVYDDD